MSKKTHLDKKDQKILQEFQKNFWIDKENLSFYGIQTGTMMSIIRLKNKNLFIHSPTKLTPKLKQEIDQIGKVKYIISPNKLHHLYILDYQIQYPEAEIYSLEALTRKRKDLKKIKIIEENSKNPWNNEIDQIIFKGSFFLDELVFFHKESKTLIITDLIQEYDEKKPFLTRLAAKLIGVFKKHAVPRDLRLSIKIGNKEKAKKSVEKILKWDFENITFCHAPLIYKKEFTKKEENDNLNPWQLELKKYNNAKNFFKNQFTNL